MACFGFLISRLDCTQSPLYPLGTFFKQILVYFDASDSRVLNKTEEEHRFLQSKKHAQMVQVFSL